MSDTNIMTYHIIIGTAFPDPTPIGRGERVRAYTDRNGQQWIGHDTLDVEYFCGRVHMADALIERHGIGIDRIDMRPEGRHVYIDSDHADDGVTLDWALTDHGMPDYHVDCTTCGDRVWSPDTCDCSSCAP